MYFSDSMPNVIKYLREDTETDDYISETDEDTDSDIFLKECSSDTKSGGKNV